MGYLLAPGERSPDESGSASVEAAPSDDPGIVSDLPAAAPSVRRLARQLSVALAGVEGTGPGGRIIEDDVTSAASRKPAVADLNPEKSDAKSFVATPRARRAAKKNDVDIQKIVGSGKDGRIRERDVLIAVKHPASNLRLGTRRIPVSARRRIIANRLSESAGQTVPVTITTRADASNLVSLRDQFKAAEHQTIPAIHDIVVMLVAQQLQRYPLLSSRWDGDFILLPDPDQIHIGLAVDTEEGLIVPVLRNVLSNSLVEIAGESARVIERARNGRLSGNEMSGAVFTISNLGSFGIDAFTPVINLPETAILGLGAIRQEPVVSSDGRIEARRIMTLSLTFDHRVIDGAPAAGFLQSLSLAIGNPAAMLIAMGTLV